MSDGTRSKAITATAPASSAILACSAFTTSIITPPFCISAIPLFTLSEPTIFDMLLPLYLLIKFILRDKLIFKKVQFIHNNRGQIYEIITTTLLISL
nr:exported hypothetical protein [Staphylococcus capitis CR01]